jgi:hypothetical protein
MKTLLLNIILSLSLIANGHGESVQEDLQSIAVDVSNRELIVAKAKSIESSMPAAEVVGEVMSALMKSQTADSEAAGVCLLWAMKPFPFAELVNRYALAKSSRERGFILWVLDLPLYQLPGFARRDTENAEQIRQLEALAISALADTGDGMNLYGEARGYGVAPLRVCDMGYNILITYLGLQKDCPVINIDEDEIPQRDIKIGRLRSYLKTHQK